MIYFSPMVPEYLGPFWKDGEVDDPKLSAYWFNKMHPIEDEIQEGLIDKRIKNPGVGSGGTTGFGKANFNYSHGRCTFRRWARERKETIGLCESCGKDIKNANRFEWCGHHKDHDSTHNIIENLILLCKQCHQIEHECWKAFQCS